MSRKGAVMDIRQRKYQRGQAIGELMISLIAMCAVTIGLLVIAVLGMSGVRNVITAREKADKYSMSGIENGSSSNIETWTTGNDGLLFTNDDVRKSGTAPKSDLFLGELTDNTGQFKISSLAQTKYAENAFESKVIESNLFLSAARLTAAQEIISDPLSLYHHFDAARIMRAFGFTSNFTVSDKISMPVNPQE